MLGAILGQRFQIEPFAIDKMRHQRPAEYLLVAMVKTGPQSPKAPRRAARQIAKRHGLGLLLIHDAMGMRDQVSLTAPRM
jgi:hypothetical protein